MKKLLAVLGATAAGFAAGMLLAPKSGAETRKDIKHKALKLKQQSEDQMDKARSAADSAAKTVKKNADDVADEVRRTAKKLKKQVDSL